MSAPRPRVGASACLLGDPVRYDGGDKRCELLYGELAGLFEWIRVCPEVETGLGCPRPPMQLVSAPAGVRLQVIGSGRDVTRHVEKLSRERIDALLAVGLSGFVLKSRSPSCGLGPLPVAGKDGVPTASGARGIFARLLCEAAPWLPVIEAETLQEAPSRRAFVEEVCATWLRRGRVQGRERKRKRN